MFDQNKPVARPTKTIPATQRYSEEQFGLPPHRSSKAKQTKPYRPQILKPPPQTWLAMQFFASRFTRFYPSPRRSCIRQGFGLRDQSLRQRALHSTNGLDTLSPPSQSADVTPLQKIILGSIQANTYCTL